MPNCRPNLLLTLLAIAAYFSAIPAIAQSGAQSIAIPVVTTKVKRDKFVDRIEALGTLKANESIVLTAAVTETVTAVHFDDGQRVEAGTVLVEMTSAEEHAQLAEARARSDEAGRQYERIKPLTKGGAAPVSVVDEKRREYQTAQAQLNAMKSRLEDRLLLAPFAGVLGLRKISPGALVTPGDMVATLDDDSVMKLDFTVPSTYLADLSPGQKIIATSRAFPNSIFEGVVSAIDSRVDEVTRSITVRARIPNTQQLLRPGLLMTVELLKNERQAIVIPENALIPEGLDQFVLVAAKEGEKVLAQKRQVKIGARRPGEVEIVSGLEPGEQVIIHGSINARPGQEVLVTSVENGNETLQEILGKKQEES